MSIAKSNEALLGELLFRMSPHEMMINIEKIIGQIISGEIKTDTERVTSALEIAYSLGIKMGVYDSVRRDALIHALTHIWACKNESKE